MDSHLKVESCKHFHATDIRFNGSLQYCSRRRWLHRWISYAPTQGSETHIYDFFVRTVEKNALFVCLCHSVLSVSFVFHYCMKQRTSRFEKAASRQQKIPIMRKHYTRMSHCFENFWITSSSSRFAWFELLMNQLGRKMSVTQGIKTWLSLSE